MSNSGMVGLESQLSPECQLSANAHSWRQQVMALVLSACHSHGRSGLSSKASWLQLGPALSMERVLLFFFPLLLPVLMRALDLDLGTEFMPD